jgi:hypothetical protein
VTKRERKDKKKEKKGERKIIRNRKEGSKRNKGKACRRGLHENAGHRNYLYSWRLQIKYDFKTIKIKLQELNCGAHILNWSYKTNGLYNNNNILWIRKLSIYR